MLFLVTLNAMQVVFHIFQLPHEYNPKSPEYDLLDITSHTILHHLFGGKVERLTALLERS